MPTGASVADVACAYAAVMDVYRHPHCGSSIENTPPTVSAHAQMDMMLALISLVKRATRWLLRNRRRQLAPAALIAQFGAGLEQLPDAFPDTVARAGRRALREPARAVRAAGR